MATETAENITETDTSLIQLCTFYANDRLFGVRILDVREISTSLSTTPIPHAPKAVRGFTNIRGQVLMVLCLRTLMGYPLCDGNQKERLVLFKNSVGPNFGIAVDKIGDIIDIDPTTIIDRRKNGSTPPPGVERRQERSELIEGVCMRDESLVMVLKGHALLNNLDLC